MALCSVCNSIPFEELPNRKLNPDDERPNSEPLQGLFYLSSELIKSPYPWHADFSSMGSQECDFCELVQSEIQVTWGEYESLLEANKLGPELLMDDAYRQLPMSIGANPINSSSILVGRKINSGRTLVLADVGMTVEQDSSLASQILGRAIRDRVDSTRSLMWVEECLKQCLSREQNRRRKQVRHNFCVVPSYPMKDGPRRLLDLRRVASSGLISLVETGGTVEKYAALTYCWGQGAESLKTVKSNIAEIKSGISVERLQPTLRDAVNVAHGLAIDYLWIDSLCIIQDSTSDWIEQSVQMSRIYKNAFLTISATDSASVMEGFSYPVPDTRSINIVVRSAYRPRANSINMFIRDMVFRRESKFLPEMSTAPISTRGWTLQERSMSRRVLHVRRSGLYFECNNGLIAMNGISARRPECIDYFLAQLSISGQQSDIRIRAHEFWWRHVVRPFIDRNFTNITDRLPATSGIAELLNVHTDGEYAAGMWLGDTLLKDMLFVVNWSKERLSKFWGNSESPELRSYKGKQYVAPSWSWASKFGGIMTSYAIPKKDIALVKKKDFVFENKVDNYGRVEKGWLEISGPLVPLELIPIADYQHVAPNRDSSLFLLHPQNKATEVLEASIDLPFRSIVELSDFLGTRPVFALLLSQCQRSYFSVVQATNSEATPELDQQEWIEAILVTTSQSGEEEVMQRIGRIDMTEEQIGTAVNLKDPGSFTSIKLV